MDINFLLKTHQRQRVRVSLPHVLCEAPVRLGAAQLPLCGN